MLEFVLVKLNKSPKFQESRLVVFISVSSVPRLSRAYLST